MFEPNTRNTAWGYNLDTDHTEWTETYDAHTPAGARLACIGMSDAHLAMSLLTDALCYSMWVVVLFSVARQAPAFNRWTRARSSGELQVVAATPAGPTTPDSV